LEPESPRVISYIKQNLGRSFEDFARRQITS
jgi:hypothetical protein